MNLLSFDAKKSSSRKEEKCIIFRRCDDEKHCEQFEEKSSLNPVMQISHYAI